MESANFHHHRQQQDHHQLADSSFSCSSNPVSINGTMNNINSRNLDTNCTDYMVQEYLRFPYNGIIGYPPLENYVTQKLQRLARIKDEFSVGDQSNHPKFLELLNCSPTSSMEDLHSSYMKNNDHHQMSYSNNNNNNQEDFQMIINDRNSCSNGTFSQVFPTTSNLSMNQFITSSASSSAISLISSGAPFDMNCLPALDLGSPRLFDDHFSQHSSLNAFNIIGGRSINYGFDHRMHQSNHRPADCPNKAVSNTGSTCESTKKRPPSSKYIDVKATRTIKKPKSEPRSSVAPPFQVRKDKLGDRIAAIQQLVSPFGKTDTASVLMEAIGYIKFQQTQVQTLSLPYMKSTNKIGGLSSCEGIWPAPYIIDQLN